MRALDNATEMAVDGSFVADRPFTSEHSAVRCSCTGSTFHLLLVARDFYFFFFLHVARGGCCWLLLEKFFENQPTRRTLLQHRPIVWNGSINRKLTASFGESRNVSKEQNPPKGQRCLTHTHTLSKGKISFGKTTGKPRAGERGGINKFRIFTRPTQKHFFFFQIRRIEVRSNWQRWKKNVLCCVCWCCWPAPCPSSSSDLSAPIQIFPPNFCF